MCTLICLCSHQNNLMAGNSVRIFVFIQSLPSFATAFFRSVHGIVSWGMTLLCSDHNWIAVVDGE